MDYLIELSGERQELGLGMPQKDVERYCKDERFIAFEFESKTLRWWPRPEARGGSAANP
jgi:hypothetical protein